MILGTSRGWYIFAALLFVLGLLLVVTDLGGGFGNGGGAVLVIIAMIVFAGAPMRYGRDKAPPAPPEAPVVRDGSIALNLPPTEPSGPPPPRAEIEARDASEV